MIDRQIKIPEFLPFVSKYRVGLSCACLSVSQKCSVVAVKNSLHKVTTVFIQILLVSWVHDMIEPEYLFFVVLSLDVDCIVIDLPIQSGTSTISSISLSL